MGDWTTENKSSQAPVRLSYYGIYLVYNTSATSERLGLERTLDSREQIEIVDQCLLHRTTAATNCEDRGMGWDRMAVMMISQCEKTRNVA